MSLPQRLPLTLMQTQWATQLNPVIANPLNSVNVLENIQLKTGANVINHLLSRTMQGWFVVDQQGVASLHRSAPFNNLTLTLVSSADVTVNLGVY